MTHGYDRRNITRRTVLASLTATAAASPIFFQTSAAQTLAVGQTDKLPSAWTSAERIPLWEGRPPTRGFVARPSPVPLPARFVRNVGEAELKVFRPARPNGRALLAIPGGGYYLVSVLNEGLDVARRATASGYTVFVLVYRLPGEGWNGRADVPLQDAQRAMRIVRGNAARYGFDPRQVAALGFSAGGHLAASLATGHSEPVYAGRDAIDRVDPRPMAVGLIYPVIAMDGPHIHAGSRDLLLGPAPDAALIARRSPARRVTAATPPLFIVHTIDDRTVPVENSLEMIAAMKSAGRPVEAHLFSAGGHGFGLGQATERSGAWPGLFEGWLGKVADSGK